MNAIRKIGFVVLYVNAVVVHVVAGAVIAGGLVAYLVEFILLLGRIRSPW